MKTKACKYCGCTEANACLVTVADQPPSIRTWIESIWQERGLAPPETIGCCWISHRPPVCSAPACLEKHQRALTESPQPLTLP